ncbi:MT-A70 family methyltransferase [Micavibrio aeruginosavorus]|uniref:MT-A70 family methyltransferase n=1 Tax=Micavibrio aeruginosavorus TaxID=349221 RepID=UPI003F4AE7F4
MIPVPQGQYGVIYADPAWAYTMYSDKGYGKSPDAHYQCSHFDVMAALRDQIIFAAAPNCALVMWGVWPMLPQAYALMDAWGFEYKTGGSWGKITRHGKSAFGTGYVLRSAEEPFLIGTIGHPKIKNRSTRNRFYTGPLPEDLHDLQISLTAERREHSRKPDEMATIIEELFDGPYLELFARTTRPGWTSWGNETAKFSGVQQ